MSLRQLSGVVAFFAIGVQPVFHLANPGEFGSRFVLLAQAAYFELRDLCGVVCFGSLFPPLTVVLVLALATDGSAAQFAALHFSVGFQRLYDVTFGADLLLFIHTQQKETKG